MEITATLTRLCNLNCKHCYIPATLYTPDSKDEIDREKFIEGLKNLGNQFSDITTSIKITGGEFVLLSYGKEIVKHFRMNFPKAKLIAYTNGIEFYKNPELFDCMKPDEYHIGIDEWHSTIKEDGKSEIVEFFINQKRKHCDFSLDIHWAENSNRDNSDLFLKLKNFYQPLDKEVTFHYSNLGVNRGRAKSLESNKNFKRKLTKCTYGESMTLLYDFNCYACHWGLKDSFIGSWTDKNLRSNYDNMKKENLYKVMHSDFADEFINSFLEDEEKYSSFVLCNECEMVCDKKINLKNEANILNKNQNISPEKTKA